MRPTLEETDRQSEDVPAGSTPAAAGQAGSAAPPSTQRQLSLHSSVQVRLDLDMEDLEDVFAGTTLLQQQQQGRGAEDPPAASAASKEARCRLPAADAPRGVGRARFTEAPDGGSGNAADEEDQRLPALKKRSASFTGGKAALSPGVGARDMARAKSAAGTARRRSSTLGFPSIGAQR